VTALAFEAFAREHVDFAVIEVGLGGRLDATNVVSPLVSIVTRIDFDHENFLGHSLREIAGEKAGILKPQVPAVFAAQLPEAREVLLERAKELRCPVVETGEVFSVENEAMESGLARATAVEIASGKTFSLEPRLAGRFQLQNALNAVAAARILQNRTYRITDENIETGIATTEWPGRLERLQTRPDVYLDGAHNPGAAKELARFLEENFVGRRVYLIFGAMRDKAVDEVTGMLFPRAQEVIFTQPRTPRAVSARQLAEMAGDHAKKFAVIEDAEHALESALSKAGPEDAIFITGSLYLVGEMRHAWNARRKVASLYKSPLMGASFRLLPAARPAFCFVGAEKFQGEYSAHEKNKSRREKIRSAAGGNYHGLHVRLGDDGARCEHAARTRRAARDSRRFGSPHAGPAFRVCGQRRETRR
jgi:dihydrofolate synthase/folylpolyglutamate synthase